MRPEPRSGHSLVELVVAALLLATLGTASVALLTAQMRQVRTLGGAAEAGNAVRFTARLLRSELRTLVEPADIEGLGPDSSRQRVFRGGGVPCAVTGPVARVRYRGLRDPDPAKDSLLILSSGGEHVLPLVSVRTPPTPACAAAPGERVLDLTMTGTVTPGVLLVFERGTWHLSGSALRYARGHGGRQPVTTAVLADDSTDMALMATGAGAAAVRLRIAAMVAGGAAGGLLGEVLRIALLNLAAPLDSAVLAP